MKRPTCSFEVIDHPVAVDPEYRDRTLPDRQSDRRDKLLLLVIEALALADNLSLTDVGIALDTARVHLVEPPVARTGSIAFH